MARKFFLNRSRHLARFLFWTIGTFVGLGSLVAIVLAISLSKGPIPLDFAASYLDGYVSSKDSPVKAAIEGAELAWDKENGCLTIQAKGVHVQNENGDDPSLKLPNFEFRFRISHLLRLKFLPFEVAITEPHLNLYRGLDGQLSLTKDHEEISSDTLLENIAFTTLARLRNVKVTNLRIDVHDLKTGETWDVPRLDLTLKRKGTEILCDLEAHTRGAKASGKLQILMDKQGKETKALNVKFDGLLKDLDFDDLDKFWHPKLAVVPRTWIMENLSAAKVKKADIHAAWTVNLERGTPQTQLIQMAGEIHFTGMKVLYFGDFPPVTGVDGIAKYTDKDFNIDILKGKLKDINVTGGKILISNMHMDDQTINIDLDLDGPLNTALNILDERPLHLSSKLDLKPQNVQGNAKGKIHFNFPLETTVTVDQVNYTAKTSLKDVVMAKPLGGNSATDLKDGDFMLTVDRGQMLVQGTGNYGKIPANITWQQKFEDHPKDWTVRYDIDAKLNAEEMAELGYGGYTEGPVSLKASLTERDKTNGKLTAELDYTDARILLPFIQEIHVPGNSAKATLEADLKNRMLQKITQLNIAGKGFSMSPRVEINPENQTVTAVDCPQLRLGKNQLAFKLAKEKGTYRLDLKGQSLDLEALINYFKSRATDDEKITPFHFNCDVENAWFHEGKKRLHKLSAKGFHDADSLQSCSASGQLIDVQNSRVGELKVEQRQNGPLKELSIRSNNAGETLDLLGLTAAVNGGDLALIMSKKSNANWTGKLKIHDFHIMDAPTVTRMLSIISPFGILEVVAGKPLAFAKFSTKVVFDKDRILVKQGRAMGPSIGLNVNGVINRKSNTLDLQGTILPYNAINALLAKVPVVSQLLGGKGGGIFGFQYVIEGPMDDPTTSVNPLSMLTPGILRNVFSRPDPEEGEEDGESAE